MKKLTISTALGAMLLAGGAALAQQAPGPRHPLMEELRGDGDISRAQLVASLEKKFAALDANGDGKVTKDEMEAAHKARMAERLDQRFAEMDANHDGQISKAEFTAGHEAMMARWKEHAEHGGDGMGRGHMLEGAGGMMGHGRMGKGMMGANSDGPMTKEQFMAPALAMFDRADANHDGVLTKAERDAARQSMRAKWQSRKGMTHTPPPGEE